MNSRPQGAAIKRFRQQVDGLNKISDLRDYSRVY